MAKRQIYDISLPISESLVVWPGDIPVNVTQSSHLAAGNSFTVSQIHLSSHAGTHVDAPTHFILGGGGVDTLDLNVMVGMALVVEALEADMLSEDVLKTLSIPPGTERVLFHTRNSKRWARGEEKFSKEFVAVTKDGAQWMVSQGIRLVGVDYLSVAPFEEGAATHRILLNAGVIVIEGLNLNGIAPGEYQLVCLPLNIVGIDGAPARVVLIKR